MMNRVSAKCGDCNTKFQADADMLEAGDAVVAGNLSQSVSRTAVFCPNCTSTHIERA